MDSMVPVALMFPAGSIRACKVVEDPLLRLTDSLGRFYSRTGLTELNLASKRVKMVNYGELFVYWLVGFNFNILFLAPGSIRDHHWQIANILPRVWTSQTSCTRFKDLKFLYDFVLSWFSAEKFVAFISFPVSLGKWNRQYLLRVENLTQVLSPYLYAHVCPTRCPVLLVQYGFWHSRLGSNFGVDPPSILHESPTWL